MPLPRSNWPLFCYATVHIATTQYYEGKKLFPLAMPLLTCRLCIFVICKTMVCAKSPGMPDNTSESGVWKITQITVPSLEDLNPTDGTISLLEKSTRPIETFKFGQTPKTIYAHQRQGEQREEVIRAHGCVRLYLSRHHHP